MAALTIAVAGSSAAAPKTKIENTNLTGQLTITWTGNPAGGCAAAGVCGVSGTLEVVPSPLGEVSVPGPLPAPIFQLVDASSIARVVDRNSDGATVATCTDVVPVLVSFVVTFAKQGIRAVIPRAGSFAPPSSGRCAGPTAADLGRLVLPASPFGAHNFNLSGQWSYEAGPFTVAMTSTLRGLISLTPNNEGGGLLGGGFPFGGGPGPAGKPDRDVVYHEHASVVYRIAGVSGQLSTAFAGTPSPQCLALGTCGTAGTLRQSLDLAGTLTLSGSRRVPHRVSSKRALADLRAGLLGLRSRLSASQLRIVVAETMRNRDGTRCTDTNTGGEPLSPYSTRPNRTTDRIALGAGFLGAIGAGIDVLRTRCAGPSVGDVAGDSAKPLAETELGVLALSGRTLTLRFARPGRFRSDAYVGSRSGAIVVRLVRVAEQGGTTRRIVTRFGTSGAGA